MRRCLTMRSPQTRKCENFFARSRSLLRTYIQITTLRLVSVLMWSIIDRSLPRFTSRFSNHRDFAWIAGDASFFHENDHSAIAWVPMDVPDADKIHCRVGAGR